MQTLAVLPVSDVRLLRKDLNGWSPLDLILDKLQSVRGLNHWHIVARKALTSRLPTSVPVSFHEDLEASFSLLWSRAYFHAANNLENNYVFVNPAFPFLTAEHVERAVLATKAKKAAVTVLGGHSFSWKNGSSIAQFRAAGVNALAAVQGTTSVRQADVWFFGERVDYIPLNDIEAVNVLTAEGLRMAQALISLGEV